eukprot:4534409-Amphidinium_carterae.1
MRAMTDGTIFSSSRLCCQQDRFVDRLRRSLFELEDAVACTEKRIQALLQQISEEQQHNASLNRELEIACAAAGEVDIAKRLRLGHVSPSTQVIPMS